MKKIRVLVVDDSLLFRETIARGLAADPQLEVVATAADAFEAKEKILELAPDVMLLDVQLPKLDGIEFLKMLMPQYPLPVVVISSVSKRVFEALESGAVDFVTKPSQEGTEAFVKELIAKLKIAATANVGAKKKPVKTAGVKVIAIGSSTGGTEAVLEIVKTFTANMPPTLVVQHMPPVFTRLYAERLNGVCPVEVREAKNGDRLRPGLVLIAPGNYHMRLKKDTAGLWVECFQGEKVSGHCPSVDVLFHSVAECVGSKAIGIILTGMGADGAKGLLAMRNTGARTIGQNEQTCVVYGMPKAAKNIGAVEKEVALDEIPQLVRRYVGG